MREKKVRLCQGGDISILQSCIDSFIEGGNKELVSVSVSVADMNGHGLLFIAAIIYLE
jgi:hypothetical protein